MPLEILGALVVFGIGGVVLLIHLLRMSRPTAFGDDAEARRVFAADYPEPVIRALILAEDGRAVVLETDHGPGLLTAFGNGRFTRLFSRGDIRRVDDRGGRLRVILDDFGAPSLTIAFADPQRRAAAKAMLEKAI